MHSSSIFATTATFTTLHTNIQETGIFKLHSELFWYIFMINADLESESAAWGSCYRNEKDLPLNTIRLTSQVCQHWRDLILGSPIIWANIVELQVLRQKPGHWRNEVMKQTGSATLCIRGDVTGHDEISTSFFFFLLNCHWERIWSLDVSMLDLPLIDVSAWTALQRPAPYLEVMRLIFPERTHLPVELLTTEDPEDFLSGYAPRIREFHCPELTFSIFSAWIPQLHAITVSNPLSISDLFSLLADMPLLESLKIQESVLDLPDSENSSKRIFLPALKRIDLNHGFRTCLLILEHVIAFPQCILCLSTFDFDLRGVTRAEITRLQSVLTRYATGYTDFTAVERLFLHLVPILFPFPCLEAHHLLRRNFALIFVPPSTCPSISSHPSLAPFHPVISPQSPPSSSSFFEIFIQK